MVPDISIDSMHLLWLTCGGSGQGRTSWAVRPGLTMLTTRLSLVRIIMLFLLYSWLELVPLISCPEYPISWEQLYKVCILTIFSFKIWVFYLQMWNSLTLLCRIFFSVMVSFLWSVSTTRSRVSSDHSHLPLHVWIQISSLHWQQVTAMTIFDVNNNVYVQSLLVPGIPWVRRCWECGAASSSPCPASHDLPLDEGDQVKQVNCWSIILCVSELKQLSSNSLQQLWQVWYSNW